MKTHSPLHATPKKSVVRSLLVLLVCLVVFLLFQTREPRYNGRPLTSWLQQYADPRRTGGNEMEARNAICSIGAKLCLPTLLKLITAKNRPVDNWVSKAKKKFGLNFLHWRYAAASNLYGLAGFQALGTNAAPAIGALTKLLDDKDRAIIAFQCLGRIGKPAEGALCQCLTNQDWRVRYSAMAAMAGVTDDPETFISRVKVCLNDTNLTIRVAAVQTIGSQYPEAPQQVVSCLRKLLNDPHQDVRICATNTLKEVDPRALHL